MPKIKLLIILVTLTILALACNTLSPLLEEQGIPILPSETPLPLSPTNTWPPPAEFPTETPTREPVIELPAETSETNIEVSNTLFVDDFSDPKSGWDQYDVEEGFAGYIDGAYKIGIFSDQLFGFANPGQAFTDAAIEVIVTKAGGGDDSQFGIICRYQDEDNFYALLVSSDGYASIRQKQLGTEFTYLAEWTNSPVINQGNATNLLRAECVGNRLSLYANGVLLIEAFDSELPSGDVGLLAGTFSAENVEVLFDNFIVSAP